MALRWVCLLACLTLSFAQERHSPVLVELFTSEGCSSCPPADRLLAELSNNGDQPIIALSEHVDYWDHLGWRDPFSSPVFSSRQQAYGDLFQLESVYTPQMVVDGMANVNGSDRFQAHKMIQLASEYPKATVTVSRRPESRIAVRVEQLAVAHSDSADVYLALTENGLESSVRAGENAGSRLRHVSVVRSLTRLAQIDARRGAYAAELAVAVREEWRHDRMRAVIFVQDRKTRRVIGAASCAL